MAKPIIMSKNRKKSLWDFYFLEGNIRSKKVLNTLVQSGYQAILSEEEQKEVERLNQLYKDYLLKYRKRGYE